MSSAAVYMKEGEWGESEYSEGSATVISNNNGAEIGAISVVEIKLTSEDVQIMSDEGRALEHFKDVDILTT